MTAAVERDRPDGIEDNLLAKLRGLTPNPVASAKYRIEEGWPADQILALADEVDANLIVVGTHGRSGLRRLVMGSMAEAVNRKTACQVLTVRGESKPVTESTPGSLPGAVESVADAEAGPED
jgi:nucleotide-binding universal stress UspA family protein